jgi:rhamnose utilization protein RhaD (predicted bifunctional aldolase and dehydrogenase)
MADNESDYRTPAAEAVAALLARSNRLGADPKNINYAGGNTSAKGTATDPVTGRPAGLMWVKGSGGDLGTLRETGLAVLRLDTAQKFLDERGTPHPFGRIVTEVLIPVDAGVAAAFLR